MLEAQSGDPDINVWATTTCAGGSGKAWIAAQRFGCGSALESWWGQAVLEPASGDRRVLEINATLTQSVFGVSTGQLTFRHAGTVVGTGQFARSEASYCGMATVNGAFTLG